MATYRKYTKRRSSKKKSYSKGKVSSSVKAYVKKAMVKVKPEVKRTIDYYTEGTVDAVVTPYQYYELIVGQGALAPQRIGLDIKLIGLQVKAFFRNNTTTTQMLRVLVLSCPSDTITTIATMELFKDAGVGGTTSPIIVSGTSPVNMLYPINNFKFKTHYDHVFKLGGSGSTDAKDLIKFTKFCKFGSKIHFDGTSTGGFGDASKRFFVLYLTSDPLLDGGGGAIEITGTNKWYFTDC